MRIGKNIKIQLTVLLVGILLMIIKFVAWGITSSNAILSDALESIINIATGFITLYSIYLSSKPSDFNHPYGHGKIEFVSSGIEGSLISIAGLAIIAKAVYNLFYPVALESIDTGLILVVISGAINFVMARVLLNRSGKSHSVALEAEGKHLMSDAYTTVGLVAGLALVYVTGWHFLDAVVAIVFGFLLLWMGYKTVRKAYAGIMDEADFSTLQEIVKLMNEQRSENWIDIHNFRMIKYGSVLHMDCHLTLPWYFNLGEVHDEIKKLENLISSNTTRQTEMFVHPDPCVEPSCSVCPVGECALRKKSFAARVPWTLENIVVNEKHGVL